MVYLDNISSQSLGANFAALGVASTSWAASILPAMQLLLYFAVFGILIAIAVIDIKTMTIPDGLNIALLLCGVLAIFIFPDISLLSRFIGLLCVSVPMLILTLVAPQSFGGGDVKLLAAAGFLLGWQAILLATAVGVMLGAGYGLYLFFIRKRSAQEHFAFGPMLCAGIAFALLFASQILSQYQVV